MIRSPFRRHGQRSRGQALVEFAFVLPIFLLLLFILIDFGRVIYAQHTINQDAAEGARLGAVSADNLTTGLPAGCTASPESPVGCDTRYTTRYAKIRAAARVMAPAVPMDDASIRGASGGCSSPLPADPVTASYCFYPTGVTAAGSKVVVHIEVQVNLITPIISNIVGNSILLKADASQLLQ